jgi:integrase/recombinase XerC
MAPANKGAKLPADVLSRDEINRLYAVIDGDSTLALRNRAMLATMYRGALRAGEVVALRPGDVDLDTGRLHVRRGKGGKPRTIYLDNGALAALKVWVERRRGFGFDDRKTPLFCALKGTELTTSYLRRWLPKLAAKAGIAKRVHPHIFRHSRAAELHEQGATVKEVQLALGHSNLATTSLYLDHVAPHQLRETMQAKGWRPPRRKAA